MKNTLRNRIIPLMCMFLLVACASQQNVSGQSDKVPRKAAKYFDEGYTQYQYGEYKKAEELFLKAIARHPNYIEALDALAKTYQTVRNSDAAIYYYRRVLSVDQQQPFALYELGNIYFEKAQLDSSKYFYRFFMQYAGYEDKYTSYAQAQLNSIAFAQEAFRNPESVEMQSLSDAINTAQEEYSPALTIDGQKLYYTYRDSRLSYQRQNEDLYFSELIDGEWTKAQALGPPINTVENEGAFSVSADGRYIFFTACNRSGGKGQCDIWLTMNKNGEWSEPLNMGEPINSRYWESQPSISSDGRYLYFTSNAPGGYGGTDLYVCEFTDKGWSEPRNLGPEINTSKDEQFPFIHSDGITLYFSSEGLQGMGGSDLFITHLKPDGNWAKPLNLGSPINSMGDDWNLIVSRDGKTAYFSTDRLEEGIGGMDIYSFELPKKFQAQKVNYLKGIVVDAVTKQRIGATIELIPLTGEVATNTFAPSNTGEFLVALRPHLRYALNVKAPGYLFHSENFDMPENETDEPFVITVELKKPVQGNSIVLNNVFFDTDKYSLKEESLIELNKLYELLMDNPDIRIRIEGHTDNQGSEAHNLELSANRAKAVAEFLILKGVHEERLSYKGYGSSKPVADNATDAGRAINRRTEFSIL